MLSVAAPLMGSVAISALVDGTSGDDDLTGDDNDNTLNGRGGMISLPVRSEMI